MILRRSIYLLTTSAFDILSTRVDASASHVADALRPGWCLWRVTRLSFGLEASPCDQDHVSSS